jgi:hypothetical protein
MLPGVSVEQEARPCDCAQRPAWARIEDDRILRWPVAEIAEWEELRQCPTCGAFWLSTWPEELDGSPILCRPHPPDARRLRDIDRVATLRAYCLARIEDHLGELKEEKRACKKVDCERKRLAGTPYCIEHLIAQRFGRHLTNLDRKREAVPELPHDFERKLCDAIADKRLVSFTLDGYPRIAEPHDYGVIGSRKRLFFYQVGGTSRSGRPFGWRWAELTKISAFQVLADHFQGTRAVPTERHIKWDAIIASVSERPETVSPDK